MSRDKTWGDYFPVATDRAKLENVFRDMGLSYRIRGRDIEVLSVTFTFDKDGRFLYVSQEY